MWETFNERRSMETAHMLSKPHWISFKMMYVDAFLVGVFSQIEIWKWYSFVSFLTCENNHNFSGRPGLPTTGLIPSYHPMPYFQPETQGCFLWTNQHWLHVRKFCFLGWPSVRETLEFHGTCKPFLLFWLDLAHWCMESELASQGPICHMNAISGYPQYYCFPFK